MALKVQRADGSESVFSLGQSLPCLTWGEADACCRGQTITTVELAEEFVNGELVEVKAIKAARSCWPMAG
jgi:hypothetical protein